jgi:hypothetical protein
VPARDGTYDVVDVAAADMSDVAVEADRTLFDERLGVAETRVHGVELGRVIGQFAVEVRVLVSVVANAAGGAEPSQGSPDAVGAQPGLLGEPRNVDLGFVGEQHGNEVAVVGAVGIGEVTEDASLAGEAAADLGAGRTTRRSTSSARSSISGW